MGFALISYLIFHDHEETQFFWPAICMLLVAVLFASTGRKLDPSKIGFRMALFYAVGTWMISGVLGAVPVLLLTRVSVTDAVFESVSALTTTGATILSGLDRLPHSFLLYRQFLQWLGGLGVVVFVVAVLPMLNVGGMKLLKAETPGPIKDDKLTPRLTHTAHYLWMVYLVLTVACAAAYFLCGMTLFDAIAHSFTTVSTGGFSTHDASMGYFQSLEILQVSDVFMLLGAISFALHFRVWRKGHFLKYWRDEETRFFLLIVAGLTALGIVFLVSNQVRELSWHTANDVLFMIISFITSTGFGTADFTDWPPAMTFLLVFAGYLGGCAGSTAGGNKIIRNILSIKLVLLELKRLVHPRGVFLIRYQGAPVEPSVLSATAAFMTIAAFSSLLLTIGLMLTGMDFWSSFSAVAACLNVLGPAFGQLGSNFQPLSDAATWELSFAMILGRLEYFTILALLLPSFWLK